MGKVGVDVRDQLLQNKTSYADGIRSSGWSRKWGMHSIQQVRHNTYLAWRDIHGLSSGNEQECRKWANNIGKGNGKVIWAYQVGLIKGLLAHIRQYIRANRFRSCDRNIPKEEATIEHTVVVVDRGDGFKNMNCTVCMHLKQICTVTREGSLHKVCKSKYWCPHPDCRAHTCTDHHVEIHDYLKKGICLSKYHKMKYIANTILNLGKHKKATGSGRPSAK